MTDGDTDDSIDSVLGAVARAPSRMPPFVVGKAIGGGRYTVHELVGRGGMGTVYRAHDGMLRRDVALKLVDDGVNDRLRDEVRLAHEVTHRNVCRTYDLEDVDGRWVVKMELVVGPTLAEHVAEAKRLPYRDAIAIATQIAHGLRAAHDRGVVHRDLKPHNIIIEKSSDRVVLMDFGLACLDGEGGGDSSGTPAFMAPEQVLGGDVDRRADLYALGCVIYFMVAGQVVFPAETAAVMMQRHLVDTPPALPDAPAWLARVVRRLLAKDPAERPSAAETIGLLAGPRRRWMIAAAAVIAAIAIVAIAWPRPKAEWHPVVRDMGRQYEEYATGPVWSPDGTRIAYASDRSGTMRIYVESVADGSSFPIGPADLAVWVPRWAHDGSAIYAGDYSAGANVYKVEPRDGAPAENLGALGWFDDCARGRWLYTTVGLDSAFVMREADGKVREVLRLSEGTPIAVPHCDAAGDRAVYTRSVDGVPQIWSLSLADGQTHVVAPEGFVGGIHPDGRTAIVTLTRDGKQNLWEVPIDGGEPLQLTFGDGPDIGGEVSPDGRQLAFISGHPAWANAQIFAFNVATGAWRKLTSQVESFAELGITPDGRSLIASNVRDGKNVIAAVSTRDGVERVLVEGLAATLTRDGRELIYTVGTGPTSVYAMPIDGGDKRLLATIPNRIELIRFDSAGVLHACTMAATFKLPLHGGSAELEAPMCLVPAPVGGWMVELRRAQTAALIAPGQRPDDPAAFELGAVSLDTMTWTPDGTAIIFPEPDMRLHRFDVATHADTLLPDPGIHDFGSMVLSPDGTTLYMSRSDTHTRRHILTNFGDRPRPH